jgi:hypothetical protein
MDTKRIILLSIMIYLFVTLNGQNIVHENTIGNIEKHGSWYEIYNEQSKKIKTVPTNIGELIGFGASFFIVKRSNWYYLYNESGTKYKTLPTSIGEAVSVASSTFTVRKGAWLHIYDSTGKKIKTRQIKK